MSEAFAEAIPIVDVRGTSADGPESSNVSKGVAQQILNGLNQSARGKTLPTLLLYDEAGLRLYDDITTNAPEYYLFRAEEQILKDHAEDICKVMHNRVGEVTPGEVVLELGAGSLRKTSHILAGLSSLVSSPATQSQAPITYFALDLEKHELDRTLRQLAQSELGILLRDKVEIKGMLGTYENGLKFVQEGGLRGQRVMDGISTVVSRSYTVERGQRDSSPSSTGSSASHSSRTDITTPSTPGASEPPLHIMFLGSSLGNFTLKDGADFLCSLPLRAGCGDTLLLGLDHDNDRNKIEIAYNDPKGYTKKFIMNGLKVAGRALGDESLFDENLWDYVNLYNEHERRHEAYFQARSAHTVQIPSSENSVSFDENELVRIEVSQKFSEVDTITLFTEANLRPIQRWMDNASQYSLWLLERPPFMFPLLKKPSRSANSLSSPFGVPSVQDWENMWAAWDFVTLRMIPPSMLFQKPIDLRHICLFYLGHIPTFLDIHLSRLLKEPHTEPEEFKYIFERGIDPNVDDPTQCHPHSEVPQSDEDWPSLSSILSFRTRVRERVLKLYDDIESGKVQLTRKIGRVLFMTYEHEGFHIETLLYMLIQRAGTGTIPPPDFAPPMWDSLAAFWDSAPVPSSDIVTIGPTTVSIGHDDVEREDNDPVKSLEVAGHEFGWDNESPRRLAEVDKVRIEWRPVTNGQFLHFFNGAGKGKVQLPASWIEQDGEIFVRTLYGPVPMNVARHWPLITSYDNLSAYATAKGGRLPTESELRVFFDKFEVGYEGGSNIGFRNWHPVPATTGTDKNGGRGHNGGVWEWTSTLFDKYDGFVSSDLYPGYSADFFDGCYQVVIGGSYATVPRIAERRTVRNWYQRNYPYPWAGGRIAYDVDELDP